MNEDLKIWLSDNFERAAASFAVAILSLLTAGQLADIDMSFGYKAGTAALVAFAAVLKGMAWPKAGFGLAPWLDVAARAAFSFMQAGAVVIAGDAGFRWYQVDAWQVVLVAGGAAFFSVVKGAIALKLVANTVTPASLAKAT